MALRVYDAAKDVDASIVEYYLDTVTVCSHSCIRQIFECFNPTSL